MNHTQHVPQPYDAEGVSRDEWMAQALEKEQQGFRLIVQEFVNAYEDGHGGWWVDAIVTRDWRTGEFLHCQAIEDGDESTFDFGEMFLVEHRIVDG